MKRMKRILAVLTAMAVVMCWTPGVALAETQDAMPEETAEEAVLTGEEADGVSGETDAAGVDETSDATVHTIVLSSEASADGTYSHTAVLDGEAVTEYDYTWHADPGEVHSDVKNSPAEYYTGTEPDADAAVYIAHDIYYYPELDTSGFKKVQYDDDQEWAYYYTAEGYTDYIFATLPVTGSSVPTDMMHSEEEAYQNAVLHITEAGTYQIEGEWHGQILVDLGDQDDTFTDTSAKVRILLNGVDVTCTVAPALNFYSVYECDNTWEDQTSWASDVDTSEAGASVVIADGTENTFNGANVYRILKTKYKSEDSQSSSGNSVTLQKKRMKYDGAFYSCQSMNIDGGEAGTGVLTITSSCEGLDSELHLTINGGSINIFSEDDGINVNEDGVSVVTVNGGSLHINAGLGGEGDGIDSNGYLVINGGTVISSANPGSDSGLDSDCGSYINGGCVMATGSTMDWPESESDQVTINLQFAQAQASDEALIVTDTDGKVVFAYDPDKDEVTGSRIRKYQGAVISSPDFAVGATYYVYVGGDVTGTEVQGLYDASTVTGFDGATRQEYTGTDVGGMNPGGRPGDPNGGNTGDGTQPTPPDGNAGDGTQPTPPDGNAGDGTRPTPPDGNTGDGTRPTPPDGNTGDGTQPTPPDGNAGDGTQPTPPDGNFPGGPGGQNTGTTGTASVEFYMTDKVNSFSGVTDEGTNTTGETKASFTDVPDDAYYASAVAWAVSKSVTTGTSATTFSPESDCTRAQFVTFLWRAAGSPDVSGTATSFTDLESGSYYEKAVQWAVNQGITMGTSETTFSPDSTVTRAQTVTFLWRYSGSQTVEDGASFTDVTADIWYSRAVAWAAQTKVTTGTSETTFSPDDICTRAQIVTFLYRQSQLAA